MFTNSVDKFLSFFTTSPLRCQLLPYKSWHFWTTYPPLLVNVVCERPLMSQCFLLTKLGPLKTMNGYKVSGSPDPSTNFKISYLKKLQKNMKLFQKVFVYILSHCTNSLSKWSNYPNGICEKNTVNYAILFGYLENLAKISWILIDFFLNIVS